MSTSKEVFALRKAGQLEEAFKLALSLNEGSDPDIWEVRALTWCLVDLVDKAISQENYQILPTYRQELEKIVVDLEGLRPNALTPSEDAPLIDKRNRALSLISQVEADQRSGSFKKIITYKDIYAQRKENLDQAYQMALKATAGNFSGQMELYALAWCLIDLIKRDAKACNYDNLETYRQQLQAIAVDPQSNQVLAKQKDYVLSRYAPDALIFYQAEEFSKQENYLEAINCYQKLLPKIPPKNQLKFGWDLYRYSTQLFKKEGHVIPQIKRYLWQYLNLDVEKPSLLHSLILQLAKNIAKKSEELDLAAFLHIWGIKNF
ncbi:MAG: hypothetical protein IJU40_07505, partial [Desulfovibrionaceae bacterium]|nr:hypothetical protein [Desulfovibrionaceae bacterium]